MTSPCGHRHTRRPADPKLVRELAHAAQKAVEWRKRRDELIVQAHEEGASLRGIAEVVGITNPSVMYVIRRLKTEAND